MSDLTVENSASTLTDILSITYLINRGLSPTAVSDDVAPSTVAPVTQVHQTHTTPTPTTHMTTHTGASFCSECVVLKIVNQVG